MRTFLLLLFVISIVQSGRGQDYAHGYPLPPRYPKSDSLLLILNSYHTNGGKRIYPQYFLPGYNVTPAIKQRLANLVRRIWTDTEIKIRLKEYLIKHPFKPKFEYDFWNKGLLDSIVALRNRQVIQFDSVYHALYDSLEKKYQNDFVRTLRESPVPDEILLSAATAGIADLIPEIKQDMTAEVHYFNRDVSILALAILGDTDSRQAIFNRHKKYIAKVNWNKQDLNADMYAMILIKTQESTSLLADWLDISRKYQLYSENDAPNSPYTYFSSDVIPTLLGLIQNKDFISQYVALTNELHLIKFNYSNPLSITKDQINFVRNWMIANKGHYFLK